jgi:hypothetical protein
MSRMMRYADLVFQMVLNAIGHIHRLSLRVLIPTTSPTRITQRVNVIASLHLQPYIRCIVVRKNRYFAGEVEKFAFL